MTANEIHEHPEYLNIDFEFPDEMWTKIKIKGFSIYRQSNYFRVKNINTRRIIKPSEHKTATKFIFHLKDDNGKIHNIYPNKIFSGFDVEPKFMSNNKSEFIYSAF